MSLDRHDVYIGVQKPNIDVASQVFELNNLEFDEDDRCSPLYDEDLFVFYFPSLKLVDADMLTTLLIENRIPFSLFHGAGQDYGEYGWIHSRLRSDGSMSYSKYDRDGEYVVLSDIQMLVNNSTSVDEIKRQLSRIAEEYSFPVWQ